MVDVREPADRPERPGPLSAPAGLPPQDATWFRALVESAADVIQVIDADGRTRFVTAAAGPVLGCPPEQLVGGHFRDLVDPRDRDALEQAFERTLRAAPGQVVEGEFRVRDEAGGVRWVHARASNHLATPDVGGVVVNWRDVTAPRHLHQRLAWAATHDPLTGLVNRALFMDHLESALARATRQPQARVGVLMCDLDRFKGVNDRLGHAAGDELLRQVGRRLRDSVRPGDTVCRLGGDEFAVLCEDLRDEQEIGDVASRIEQTVRGAYELVEAREAVPVQMSVGAAVCRGRADVSAAAEELLRDADEALYVSKRAGGGVEVLGAALRTQLASRRQLESDLRRALAEEQFVLHYQPKLDLRTGGWPEVEALLRWRHPTRGLLEPRDFLALAEDRGLIVPIGRWVLATAAEQAAAWWRAGHPLRVCVNLSPRELDQPGLLGVLDAAIESAGVPAGLLNVEITERSALVDPALTARKVDGLRRRGIRVSLDDFGTGYSSLTWLQRLRVDTLKLDRGFTAQVESGRSAAIVAAVVELAAALELYVVAEGVETEAQLRVLRDLGCDAVQGYLVSPPLPADELPLPA
jgi:diguanylate cyclase (GGDEF)-like protein/PAS domain S-box-containing protein